MEVGKRRGMWQIPKAVITLFAATPYSNEGKTAAIRDRPVHAPCAALTSNVPPRTDNFSCATVHSYFIYNHALCNSEFCLKFTARGGGGEIKSVCNQHK